MPFFVLSSDAKHKNYIQKNVSAFDFMDIYAGLIGVKTPYLSEQKHLDKIASNPNPIVFNWEANIPYNSLR